VTWGEEGGGAAAAERRHELTRQRQAAAMARMKAQQEVGALHVTAGLRGHGTFQALSVSPCISWCHECLTRPELQWRSCREAGGSGAHCGVPCSAQAFLRKASAGTAGPASAALDEGSSEVEDGAGPSGAMHAPGSVDFGGSGAAAPASADRMDAEGPGAEERMQRASSDDESGEVDHEPGGAMASVSASDAAEPALEAYATPLGSWQRVEEAPPRTCVLCHEADGVAAAGPLSYLGHVTVCGVPCAALRPVRRWDEALATCAAQEVGRARGHAPPFWFVSDDDDDDDDDVLQA
jgi:hypothetical protein